MVEFGDDRLPDRFWKRVEIKDCGYITPCWVWLGAANNSGYGGFKYHGFSTTAHRFSYIKIHGEIDSSLVVDHMCRVRICVNPNHLQAVTQKQNLSTAIGLGEKGMVHLRELNKIRQARTHCPKGHEFTEDNTYWELRKYGGKSRHCKACRNANVERLRAQGYFKEYWLKNREANK